MALSVTATELGLDTPPVVDLRLAEVDRTPGL